MATRAENIETALGQLAERIVEVTASPNPDYSIGRRSISKGAYLAQLIDAQQKLTDQLADLAAADDETGGLFEIHTQGH